MIQMESVDYLMNRIQNLMLFIVLKVFRYEKWAFISL